MDITPDFINKLIIHTDSDEMATLRVPRGWKIFKDFQPVVKAILIHTIDGAQQTFELLETEDVNFAYSEIDLDGISGYLLGFWLKAKITHEQHIPETLLDPEVRKIAYLEYLKVDGSDEVIDSKLFFELTTAQVIVLK